MSDEPKRLPLDENERRVAFPFVKDGKVMVGPSQVLPVDHGALVAKAGTRVTCRNGHHVCDIVKDLHIGDEGWAECFGNWRRPEPSLSQGGWEDCHICGERYSGQALHMEDGWHIGDFVVPDAK